MRDAVDVDPAEVVFLTVDQRYRRVLFALDDAGFDAGPVLDLSFEVELIDVAPLFAVCPLGIVPVAIVAVAVRTPGKYRDNWLESTVETADTAPVDEIFSH